MNRGFSIYLDLVRFLAACLVYLYHSNQRLLVEAILPASNYGHSSVIVFFVLSGYVITYITDTKENTWTSYSASRLSRVYSVAIPAVVLTLILDAFGRALYPALYSGYPGDQLALRSLASLFFANEIWFISITSLSNVPYWSICYEIWYYAAFGLLTFLPRRAGWVAVALLALVLGPKVLLLAPIWGLGVLLYRWHWPKRWSIGWSWILLAGTFLAIAAFHYFGISGTITDGLRDFMGPDRHKEFTFSKFFPADYILGVLVFVNFAAMRNVAPLVERLFLAVEKPVKILASYTFTLYLLHQPFFLFWAAVIRGDAKGYGYWIATTFLVAVSVGLVGYFTENKRHLIRKRLELELCRLAGLWRASRGAI